MFSYKSPNYKYLIVKVLVTVSAFLAFLTHSAFANCELAPCNSNLQIVSSKVEANRYYITLKNNGSSSLTAQIFRHNRYSKTEIAFDAKDSSGIMTLLSGQSDQISTSIDCDYEINLKITSNTGSCNAVIKSVDTGKFCAMCSCKTKAPAVCLPPSCDAGGPYTNLECSSSSVAVQLSASGSSDQSGQALKYLWNTNCPQASINNNKIVNPILSLVTAPSGSATSTSCKVSLTVTNYASLSSSCIAEVTSKTCVKDCSGVVNGNALLDRCGVCNGDGSSCLDCSSVNIQGNQFILDSNANEMRDNVLKVNKQLKVASKNSNLSKTEISAENKYIQASNSSAQVQFNQVWQTTYTQMPGTVISCQSSFCVNTSTASYKAEIAQGNDSLYDLASASYKLIKQIERKAKKNKSSNLKKVQAAAKNAKAILDSSAALEAQSLTELSKIPSSQTSSC